ncbi:Cystathionine beta-synthase [Halotydeus destructor]|nr:Cystathionine beta-synthase [Halotydeus destructor]
MSESRICNSVLDLYKMAPYIRLNNVPQSFGVNCEVVAKCEFYAGSGSSEDSSTSQTRKNRLEEESRSNLVRNVQNDLNEVDVIVRFRRESRESKKLFPAKVDVIRFYDNNGKKAMSEKSIEVKEKDAVDMVKSVITKEAILCGICSGAALVVALNEIKELEASCRAVVVFDDGLLPSGSHMLRTRVIEPQQAEPSISRKVSSSVPWYHGVKVGQIVTTVGMVTVTDNDKLGYVLNLMNHKQLNEVSVVNSKTGAFLGVATSGRIMNEIVNETMKMETNVTKILDNKYPRLEKTDELTLLVELLEVHPFVVVIEKVNPETEMIAMIVTPNELLNYYTNAVNRCGK